MSYEIDIWGANRLKTKSIKQQLEIVKQAQRATYITLTSDFASEYFNLIKAEKLLELQDKLVKTQEKIVSLTTDKYQIGLCSINELLTEEKLLTSLKEEKNKHKLTKELLEESLKVYLVNYEGEIAHNNYENITLIKNIPQEYNTNIIENRPDFKQQEANIKRIGIDVQIAKREFLPKFTILGQVGLNAYHLGNLFNSPSQFFNAGILPSMDLFSGGRKIAFLKFKKYQYEEALNNYQKTILESIKEVNSGLLEYKTAQENYTESLTRLNTQNKIYTLAKYDLIKKWDEFRLNKKNKTVAGKDFLDAYNNNCICSDLFNTVGKVAIGTIYEWHKKLRINNDDWHCLINNYTFGEKTKKSNLSEEEKSELLKNLLHPNQLNIGKAIKYTKMALTQRGFKNLCCDLTYRRFTNNYKNEHYNIWVEAREGNKALHDKVLPYISRDISKLEVGDVIVGDGHKLAFFVKHPYKGTFVRPTLVAYQDWKSGGFVGFEIMLEENTQCIASALRNSIINLGKVPKYVYQDNGKAFKAKYFIENGITGLFTNLGTQPIYAKPYNAKAKPIERLFRELQDSFEVMLPSYTGTSIVKKPAQLKRNEKLHKEIFKVNIPTIEQVARVLEIWLQKYHYEQKCPHIEDKTIGEVLESGRGEGVNIDTLDDLMMAREIKNIYRNGILFLKNNYYDEALFGYKKKVIIKYSLFDLSSIKVYKLNGEFICTAKRVEPVHPLANYLGEAKDIEDLKQKTKLKKQLEKRTEQEYINHLKRNQAYTPLLTMDLPEKQKEDEIKQFSLEVKADFQAENLNGCFKTRFEKYEHLIKKENLTKSEQDWIAEYRLTDEYEQIYGEEDNKEVFNA